MALASMENCVKFCTLSHTVTNTVSLISVQNTKQTVNCYRFHIWHEELKQCLQIENTTVVLTSHREEQDVTGKNKYVQD
jgi:hypothetical protein